jgi:hypothetical protein
MKKKVIGPFSFEELIETNDTSLAMRTLLCIMSMWEQFSSYMVHHLTSPAIFVLFWTRSFLIIV